MYRIAHIAIELGVDGHRADLVMLKAAKALAAWKGRQTVEVEDVEEAVELALLHRMRRKPFQEVGGDEKKLAELSMAIPMAIYGHSHGFMQMAKNKK